MIKSKSAVAVLFSIMSMSLLFGQNRSSYQWSMGVKTFTNKQYRNYKQTSLGFNVGLHGSVNKANNIKLFSSTAIRVNLRHMFNTNFGLMLSGGFYTYGTQNGTLRTTKFGNATIEGVCALSNLLDNRSNYFKFKRPFVFLVHAGPGVSSMWNNDFEYLTDEFAYFRNQDDIITLNFGLTPQYTFKNNIGINLDLSYAYHMKQDRNFDYSVSDKKTAMAYNLTLGVTYKFSDKNNFLRQRFLKGK